MKMNNILDKRGKIYSFFAFILIGMLFFILMYSSPIKATHSETIILNNFKVTWYDCSYGLTKQSCKIDIQNLESTSRNFNLSTLISETNYNLDNYITSVNLKEWKGVSTEYPTHNITLVNKTCSYVDNQTLENITYDCSYNQSIQNGTETLSIAQWKDSKSQAFKSGIQQKTKGTVINIPKYESKEKYDDIGTLETINGTKYFLIEWTTPISGMNNGFGSAGKIAIFDEFGQNEYHPYWNISWDYRKPIDFSITGDPTNSDFQALINITYDTDMNVDFSDLRFTNYTDDLEISYFIEDKVNSSWATVWIRLDANITQSNQTLAYMYYGNSGATTTSNKQTTFNEFDDFDASNSTKWYSQTGCTFSAGIMLCTGSSTGAVLNTAYGMGYIQEAQFSSTNWADASQFGTTASKTVPFTDDYIYAGKNCNQDTFNTGACGGGVALGANDFLGVAWNSTGSYLYQNGVLADTTSARTNAMYPHMSGWAGGEVEIDWFRVRAYASSEPTYVFGDKQYADIVNPNVSIISPPSIVNTKTFLLNFSAVDEYGIGSCYYNVTIGASLEVADTTLNSSGDYYNDSVTVSSYADYVLHVNCEDIYGNVNVTDYPFSVEEPTPIYASGGGGGSSITLDNGLCNIDIYKPTQGIPFYGGKNTLKSPVMFVVMNEGTIEDTFDFSLSPELIDYCTLNETKLIVNGRSMVDNYIQCEIREGTVEGKIVIKGKSCDTSIPVLITPRWWAAAIDSMGYWATAPFFEDSVYLFGRAWNANILWMGLIPLTLILYALAFIFKGLWNWASRKNR